MDPVTQGALGAAASLAILFRRSPLSVGKLAAMGALGGMAADLDVLIRSDSDPLLAIQFHRHFTHSLAFIPVGGAIASLPWYLSRSLRQRWYWVLAAATIGYATHGLLDACTTYGTLLFWPFSLTRLSWRLVSVVDPLFTLPLLAAIVATLRSQKRRFVELGLCWCLGWLGLGAFQQQRALAVQANVAQERGHAIERSAIFPQFMNNVAWRSLYQSGGRYYVDKVRVTWTGRSCLTPGTSVKVAPSPPPKNQTAPASARAHRLFRWFSSDWVAFDPEAPDVLGDLRYSFSPTEASPIWGVIIDDARGNVRWVNNRAKRDIGFDNVLRLLGEDGPGHRCY